MSIRQGVIAGCVLSMLLAVVSGCALRQSGAVQYRYAQRTPSDAFDLLHVHNSRSGNVPAFVKGENISVRLKTAYIRHIPEIGVGSSNNLMRGEVAVVAKVFEEGAGAFGFKSNALDSARLVYFSNDVLEGQRLNLSNLPIYTDEYGGAPLGVQLAIMELDTKKEWVSGVVGLLAEAAKDLSPEEAKLADLLNGIAQTILKMHTDDTMFKFDFTLMPVYGVGNPAYPMLSPGDYVFVRKQQRNEHFDWSGVSYDEKSGLLMQGGVPFDKETYVVLSLVRTAKKLKYTPKETLLSLVRSIQVRDKNAVSDLNKALQEVGGVIATQQTYEEIENCLDALIGNPHALPEQRSHWATDVVHSLKWILNRKTQCDEVDAKSKASATKSREGCLSDEQIRQLQKKLAIAVNGNSAKECKPILDFSAINWEDVYNCLKQPHPTRPEKATPGSSPATTAPKEADAAKQ